MNGPVTWCVCLMAVCVCVGCAMADGPVAPTLGEAIKATQVKLVDGYAKQHPHLLFGPEGRAALKAKSTARPDLWKQVTSAAGRVVRLGVPAEDDIRTGKRYYRMGLMEAAALSAFVTGDEQHRQATVDWMIAHCKEPIWGVGWRENRDLQAAWHGYHIAIAYDLLYDTLTEAERKIIRDGLALHARALRDGCLEGEADGVRYAQNHTYIPATALTAIALVLIDEVGDAGEWLKVAAGLMDRSRYALGEDGWYFEGPGYFIYAIHWQVRYAEMMARATGKPMLDLPAIRLAAQYMLHIRLPGNPGVFDLGDTGRWTAPGERRDLALTNQAMFWAIATANDDPLNQLVGNLLSRQRVESDYPAAAFRWCDPNRKAAELNDIPPFRHFADHDAVTWRSGWGDDATCVLFRCGPSQGHAAMKKLSVLTDWKMNSGHTHPDIGGFWLYAGGRYLAVDTGYLARKFTRDHNTLLIDEQGQGADGTYWYERDVPYERFNNARITHSKLTSDYAYAVGRFESPYPEALKLDKVQRTIVATKQWVLTLDEIKSAEAHRVTWLVHADDPFTQLDSGAWVSGKAGTKLAVLPLTDGVTCSAKQTEVQAGTGPGAATATVRAHHLESQSPSAKAIAMAHLLVPVAEGAAPPTAKIDPTNVAQAALTITWPNGKVERIIIARPADGQPAPDRPVIIK